MKSSMIGVYMLLLSASPAIAQTTFVDADLPFRITWAESYGHPQGYEVYQTNAAIIDGNEQWQLAGEVEDNTFDYVLPDLTAVYFRVRAFKTFENEKIYSPYSDCSDRIISIFPLSKPGCPTVIPIGD